jgi:hypothetical protein
MMKKILLLILLFACLITKAQFPNTVTGGNSSTLNKQLGAYGANLGYVWTAAYSDTTAANLSFIKNVPGIVIRIGNDLWMRSANILVWIKISGGGSGGYFNPNQTSTGNTLHDGNGYDFVHDSSSNIFYHLKRNGTSQFDIFASRGFSAFIGDISGSYYGYYDLWEDFNEFYLGINGGETMINQSPSSSGSSTLIWSKLGGQGSFLNVRDTDMYLDARNGKLKFGNLTNLSTQNRLLGQFGTSTQVGYVTMGIDLLLASGVISADTTTGTTKLATQGDITRAISASVPTLTQYYVGVGDASNLLSGSANLQFQSGALAVNNSGGNDGIMQFGYGVMKEFVSVSTPASGYGTIYTKNDGTIHYKNSAGTDYDLTAGGSGTGSNLSWDAANHQVDIDGGGTSATIPYATTATDGLISSASQTIDGAKTFNNGIVAPSISDASALFNLHITAGQGDLSLSNGSATDHIRPQASSAGSSNRLPNTGNVADTLATLYDVRAGGGGSTPDLQAVTNVDNETTNDILINRSTATLSLYDGAANAAVTVGLSSIFHSPNDGYIGFTNDNNKHTFLSHLSTQSSLKLYLPDAVSGDTLATQQWVRDNAGGGGGYTNLTQFVAQNNWKIFHSDGSGDVQELSLGAAGSPFYSVGTSSTPAFFAAVDYATSGTNVKITTQNTTDVGLEIKLASSQTANALNISSSSGTGDIVSVSSAGKTLINTSSDSDPIAGTSKFKVVEAGQILSFTDNGATGQGWLAVSNGTITGFVGHTHPTDGFVIGSFTGHDVTIRQSNVARFKIINSDATTRIDQKLYVGALATAPTAILHLKAGTATAGTAPLKLTSGTNLSITEAGAIEYDGTHLYFTATNAGTRYQLDQQGGGSFNFARSLVTNTTDVGNVGVGEDDLMTYSVPAGTLGVNGDYIEFTMSFDLAANANTKQVKVKFGATTIYASGAQAQNDGVITITGQIIRTGAATQRITYSVTSNATLFPDYADYVTAGETLSGAVTLKATGEATSNDDIIQKINLVKLLPNN